MTGGAVSFREMTASDIAGGLRLCRAAGWNQLERDWRALLEPPSVFRAAVRENDVVGTAGAVVYGAELAWVCMVLVDPAERGRGLGTALVEQVLERLPEGVAVGLDATPSGQPVYTRLGFSPTAAFARLECAPAARRSAAGAEALRAHEALRPLREGDLSRVLAWDREVFGADRSRILRGLIAAAPEYAWRLEADDALSGYCLGRPGQSSAHLGPVVALDWRTAGALVSRCLAADPDRRFTLDAAPGPQWRSRLQQLGFSEQRPFTRMYRGGGPVRGRIEHAFAPVGPEFA